MMKKLCLVVVFISLFGLLTFGDTGEQEEIDFLLFLPNSGNRFVNEDQAMAQLDNVANYLMTKSLSPGKISVYGYAAAVINDIEPVNLSRDRALYVINELKKRGLSGDLFTEPVACGPVDLWSGNTDEGDRSLNRRVRILLDNTILTPAVLQAVDTGVKTPVAGNPRNVIQHKTIIKNTGSNFPWWIIPLALLCIAFFAANIIFTSRCRGSLSTDEMVQAAFSPKPEETPAAIPAAPPVPPPSERIYILTEEEIRHHAYELYQQRKGQNEDAVEDWYQSMYKLSAHYEAQGYWVILFWEMQTITKEDQAKQAATPSIGKQLKVV